MSVSESGKPWTNDSSHTTYEAANERRADLLEEWRSAEKLGMQVKVKYRYNRDIYSVKTRLHPDFEPPKAKKNTNE
jgi:hypothetical protein